MLLALVIGIGGQIFVFLTPDPLVRLTPQIPVISTQDWPGSRVTTESFISDTGPWREKRQFAKGLSIENEMHNNSHIDQMVVWYADPSEAAAAWNQLDSETYNGQPIVERSIGTDKPTSMLFCTIRNMPEDPRECWYLAYWEHWYTEVHFWSQFDEDLQLPELQQITARVDQRLMSAPAEPCYGILCTGELENAGR